MTIQQACNYAGWSKGMLYEDCNPLYGWHISDLVIYDKPKQLSEFNINRAPQSWCYVQED